MTNTLKEVMGISLVIVSYSWMVDSLSLYEIRSTYWIYFLAFFGLDFAYYWSHRFNHVINVFWNRHIIHHSSEEFNLSCALRQSISSIVGVFFFLFTPMAIMGIPAHVVALVAPIHLFAQFWYHTRLIGKMGFLEHIIVTPSHHRVHHAINPEYIDKNFSAIFIIWDKLFGTFQEELSSVPPVYGVKRQVKTWNPIIINYQHMWSLIQDTWRTKKWSDKIRLWFMPTGWRPPDVRHSHPVETVDNVYNLQKYDPPAGKLLKIWSWFQLFFNLLLMYYLLIRIADFPIVDIAFYAVFLAFSIFSYTSLMDRHIAAIPVEFIKFFLGFFLIYKLNDWYLLDDMIPVGTILVFIYLTISLIITAYFQLFAKEENLSHFSQNFIS